MVVYTSIFRAVADFHGAAREGAKLGNVWRDVRLEAEKASLAGASVGTRFATGAKTALKSADQVGRAMSLSLTVPVVAAGALMIHTFADFERAIVSAGSKSGATAAQLDQMSKAALDVGKQTRYSARQAAEAMDELAAAGFNANDAMATLRPVTDAAQASNSDLGLTARATAQAMNAFNIPVTKAAHVADVFSNAANTTALTMQGLSDALGQVGEVGPRFNQSLENTIAVVGRLVDMGVPAASAGTAVRQMMTSLASPNSTRAASLMKNLGVATRDANGDLLPMPKLLDSVKKSLAATNPEMAQYKELVGLGEAGLKAWAKANGTTVGQARQLQIAMEKGDKAFAAYVQRVIFGVEGAKAFSLAISDGKPLVLDMAADTDKLKRLTDGLTVSLGSRGAAKAFIDAHTSGGKFTATSTDAVTAVAALGIASDGTAKLIGAMFQQTTAQKLDNLMSGLETMAIVLVQQVKPALDTTIEGLTGMVNGITGFAEAHPHLTQMLLTLIAITAAIGPAIFVISKLVGITKLLVDGVKATRAALEIGATWLKLYGEAAVAAQRSNGGFLGSLKTVASFMRGGGPYAVAAAVLVGLLVAIGLKQGQAAKEAKIFTDSLTFQKGVLEADSRALLFQKLAHDGVLKAVTASGVAQSTFAKALVQGGPARQDLINHLNDIFAANMDMIASGKGDILALQEQADGARTAADALSTYGGGLDDSAAAAKLAALATKTVSETTANATPNVRTLTGAQTSLTTAQQQLSGATKTLSDDLQGAINKMTIFKKGSLDAETASLAYADAVDGMSASVKTNGSSLSEHSKKGRENRRAVIAAMQALDDKTKADYTNAASSTNAGKAVKEAEGRYASNRRELIKSAKQAGLNKAEVDKMIKKYLETPSDLKTKIYEQGAAETAKKIKDLQKQIKDLKAWIIKVTAGMHVTADKAVIDMNKSIFKKYGKGGRQIGLAGGGDLSGGGVVNSSGGTRQDNVAAIDKKTGIQKAWVSGREFVTNAAQYRKNREQVRTINAGGTWDLIPRHARGGALGRRPRDQGRGGNGAHRPGANIGLTVATHGGKGAKEFPFAALLSESAKWLNDAARLTVRSAAEALAKKVNASGGMIGGKGYANALKWARSQNGAPYTWAAAGPKSVGYDCSGFMGAIQNMIEGKNPYHRRWSTGAFRGQQHVMGFTKNKKSPFMIGVTNAGVGHTAGTLNKVNVESSGGRGVHLGAGARGWNDRLFPMHYGLAGGGPVGNAPFDLVDPHGKRYDPRLKALADAIASGKMLASGSHSTNRGNYLAGESGPELLRTRSGSQLLTSKKTLDYLSRIEAMALDAPKDPAQLPRSGRPMLPDNAQPRGGDTFNIPIYYAKDIEVSTLAAQRQLVKAARTRRG